MQAATLHIKKSFSHADKRAAVELWKGKVPQKAIRDQLGMTKATLKRILAFAKASPAIRMDKQRLPEKPGDLHAQEAPGGDPEGWVDYPLLKQCMEQYVYKKNKKNRQNVVLITY